MSSTDKEHQIEMLDVILATGGWVGGELDRNFLNSRQSVVLGMRSASLVLACTDMGTFKQHIPVAGT